MWPGTVGPDARDESATLFTTPLAICFAARRCIQSNGRIAAVVRAVFLDMPRLTFPYRERLATPVTATLTRRLDARVAAVTVPLRGHREGRVAAKALVYQDQYALSLYQDQYDTSLSRRRPL